MQSSVKSAVEFVNLLWKNSVVVLENSPVTG